MAGLDTVPRENWPPVAITFWSFRIMVGMGLLMLGLGLLQPVGALARHALSFPADAHVRIDMAPSGFIAVLAGWITTETGRQPFTVYGLLRTVDSASPLAAPAVGSSLIAFIIVYFAVFGAGVIYMLRMMAARAASRRTGTERRHAGARRRYHARRRRGARGSRHDRRDRHRHRLGVHHRLCRLRLCGDGRIRSRPRHPVSAVSEKIRSRRDHEQRGAGVGRQRDLAGARRRRPDGGVSTGLCGADAGAVHADDRDADRPGLSRRRLRISLADARRASATAGISRFPPDRCWRRWRRA